MTLAAPSALVPAAPAAAAQTPAGPASVRVGYCIDSFDIGGTELNAVRTLEALDRRRFDLTVFHFHHSGPLRPRYEALGVRMVHVPIGPLYAPPTVIAGVRIMRALRRGGIDVVHTHDLYTNILVAPWARIGGCRVIASRRWLDAAPRPGLLRLNRWSYRFAHRVLANSALAARSLVEEEGVPAARVLELPNFLGEQAFQRQDVAACAAQRRAWGVPEGAFVIGSVARLAPVKNHPMLLRAVALLDAQVHLVLVGGGPSRGALEQLAEQLQIRPRVHFTGALLPSVNLHQFFDVSVLSSFSEGFPNAVIEALAAACPMVATAVGGVPEVIVDRQTGLLVAVDDVAALAERIRELREDDRLRARLVAMGLARVRLGYHQSAVIARLEALYAQLAAGERTRATAG